MEEIGDRADTVSCGAGTVPATPSPARPRARRGSERRARRVQVGVRLTIEEKARIDATAAAESLTAPDFLRRAGLGSRARMRTPAETGTVAVAAALRQVLGQIGALGNNVNQIAHAANIAVLAGTAPAPDMAALSGVAAALDGLREEVRRAMTGPRGAP